jgi:cellulose 1,4-beta-cellobiosidase
VIDTSRDGWGDPARPTALNSTPTNPAAYVAANKIDDRPFRGDGCNQRNAGIGARPQAFPFGSSSPIVAFVWIKPPGESDGGYPTSTQPAGDPQCDPNGTNTDGTGVLYSTNAIPGANVPAGQWFGAEFQQLVAYAFPSLGSLTGIDTTPPSVPANLAAASTTSSASLTWSASTDNVGVTGYDIYRNGILVGSSTTPGFTDTGLFANTQYSYTVAAFDAAGNLSAASAAVTVTTPASSDTTPPSTPANATVTGVTSSTVSLSWTASTDNVGVAGYHVYRGIALAGTTTGTSFQDTGLTASTQYSYTVVAFDAAGNVSAASSVVSATTSPTSGNRGCTATYQVSSDWGTGFTANITVTNTGTTAITAWKVTWTWSGNQQIMSIWNAASQPSGQTETATSLSYNGALAPGASTSFGFQASYSGTNTAPTLTCAAN